VTAAVKAGGAKDAATNTNNASPVSGDQTVSLDTLKPSVTVNQASGQSDPTPFQPIHFTATFSEVVYGFVASDVTIGGTAGGTPSATVTDSGDHKTYDVAISGLTTGGTVTASVGADKANDAATNGNTASTSTDNTVTFNPYVFKGFFAPIEGTDLPIWNQVQAGQAIPIKFSLTGYRGMDIFDGGATSAPDDDYPKSQQIACTNETVTTVEETIANPGSSSLSYAAGSDQYTYVWKTDKAWANTCRQLVVKYNDGQIHRANFKFKK